MVCEKVDLSNMSEFEKFIEKHPKGHFLQSYIWGNQKTQWKWCGLLVRDMEGVPCGAMSVLIRKIPGTFFTMMYAARGPVCDIHDGKIMQSLVKGVKQLAKEHHSYVLKLDPDIPSDDIEFKHNMERLGFVLQKKALNFQNIQPQHVVRLYLTGKTKDEIFADFKSKTRYNIRLAIKKGVQVRICKEEAIDDFYRLMLETGERDHFIIRQKEYFLNMLRNLGDKVRLYMAYHEGKAIAGTIAIQFGNKVWYLYGASSNQHRNLMPNYLLQWNMIQWAIEKGCDIYDFRGISGDMDETNPLYGLYRFKSSWSGVKTEFVGEFHYVFLPGIYTLFEYGVAKMREIRRRIVIKG